jgi:hypothetical protein
LDDHNHNEKGSYSAERWNWILDEIIWTFEQLHADTDWDERYHHGVIDHVWEPVDEEYHGSKLCQLGHGPNHTHWWDNEGWQRHNDAVQNGLRLFGKYYRALWD